MPSEWELGTPCSTRVARAVVLHGPGERMWQRGAPLVMEVLIQPSPVDCGKQQMEQEAKVLGSALLGIVEVQLVRGHYQPLPQLAGAH